jgi:hypothetical protein
MTPANSLKGIVAISSVLLALVVPATTVFAATSAYQHHSAESSRPDVANRISVCSLVTSVNRLTVTRNRPLNHETFTFPATVKSTNTSRIRALAKALCALPVIPTGVIACPADLGVRYTLNFGSSTAKTPSPINPVIVASTGCQFVTGISRTRWVERTPAFWPVLGAAIGLPRATEATFRGKLTSGS